MKLINIFTFCTLVFVSCNKEEIENAAIGQRVINAEFCVTVVNCATFDCTEQLPLTALSVEIYLSEQDALMETNRLKVRSLENSHQVEFSIRDQERIYIRIESLSQGTYIASQAISLETVKVYHEVVFLEGFSYSNDNDLKADQNHISFVKPVLRQTSKYKYHSNYEITVSGPEAYKDASLDVEIVEHLGGNRYMVEERLSNPDDWLEWLYSETSINIWEFHEDSLVIVSPNDRNILSPLISLNEWNAFGGLRVVIEYPTCESEPIDLDVSFYDTKWWDCVEVEQTMVCDIEYNDLRVYFTSSAFVDGDDLIRLYNKENGIVRTIQITQSGNTTRGFDLEI